MASKSRYYSKMREIFPLKTIDDYVKLFNYELNSSDGPNLSILSIVIGLLENFLTSTKSRNQQANVTSTTITSPTELTSMAAALSSSSSTTTAAAVSTVTVNNRNLINYSPNQIDNENSFDSYDDLLDDDDYETLPIIEWNQVHNFYIKFKSQIKGSVDLSQYKKKTTRELIKKISDVIWSNLTRSYYKDKAHLQTLFSYLTGNKLDSFGVSYAVVAACQILDLKDVRLALSEDHAWIMFGEKGDEETIEITWHGKGNEDKRGQSINPSQSWLYLNGYPVICDLRMTVATLVSSINCSINANSDSEQLCLLQQRLLWLLYEQNILENYPMAIGNLGDLEEIYPTSDASKTPIDLYEEAIEVNKRVYCNYHVYPYTYLAGYQFRNGRFKDALKTWSNAADVIRKYNYTRDDEEIYKEFLEIANELIPQTVKIVSAGGCEPARKSLIPLLQDPICFAYLLRFYDGLCGWEEDSSTPVLHIGWAKPFVATISKFPFHIRSQVKIELSNEEDNDCASGIVNDANMPHSPKVKKETANTNDNDDDEHLRIVDTPPPSLKRPDEIDESDDGTITHFDDEMTNENNVKLITNNDICNKLNTDKLNCENINILNKSQNDNNQQQQTNSVENFKQEQRNNENIDEETIVYFRSQKMIGLKDLLLAEKLNTSAIQLQLTAQSQVHLTKRSRIGSFSTYSHSELDFVATTTATFGATAAAAAAAAVANQSLSSSATVGQRVSKRIRRD